MRHTLAAIVLALLVPAAGFAQAEPHHQILSTNPFGLMIKWANLEYERQIDTATTVGVSASHFADLDLSNVALLARWYPAQSAFNGFYLGARAGAYRFTTQRYDYGSSYGHIPSYREDTRVLPGAGVEMGYNWLMGRRQNVSLGMGFGLTRILGGGDSYDVPSILPAIRLVNVGIAF